MTYLTYLNYGTSAGNSDWEPVASHFVHRSELRLSITYNCKLYLKKLVRKVENMVNVSYIYIATNLNLNEQFPHLFTFPYISSAGGFQPLRFSVCRNFTHTCAGAFGFLLSTGSRLHSAIYFLTYKVATK